MLEDTLPPVVGNTVVQVRKERMKWIKKETEDVLVPSKLFQCLFCGQQFEKKCIRGLVRRSRLKTL